MSDHRWSLSVLLDAQVHAGLFVVYICHLDYRDYYRVGHSRHVEYYRVGHSRQVEGRLAAYSPSRSDGRPARWTSSSCPTR